MMTTQNSIRIGSIVTVIPVEQDFAPHGNTLHEVVDMRKPRGSAPIWRIAPITDRGFGESFEVLSEDLSIYQR